MKTVFEQMKEQNAHANIAWFRTMQQMPHDWKIRHAEEVARSYYAAAREQGLNCHVSVGGLDSITLHYFLEEIGVSVPCISCSTLEQRGVQAVHKRISAEMKASYADWEHRNGALAPAEIDALPEDEQAAERELLARIPSKPEFVFLRPLKSKVDVLKEYGWPVLSKEIAGKIALLQNPTDKNATVRHAIITGETGEYGGNRSGSRMQLSRKWLLKFGGADSEGAAIGYQAAPFKVSDRCCYYLKERPAEIWAKEHKSVPYVGLMASEGGRRQKSLMMHLCNYWGKSTTRSAPFAIFSRQDLLQLALDLNVPVPAEYGEIVRDPDGTLRTTLAQRTGCEMCGFGIQLERRPHRFDQLRDANPKAWDFWMHHVMQDETGQWYGWGRVLDYIGVSWDSAPGEIPGQLSLFDREAANPTQAAPASHADAGAATQSPCAAAPASSAAEPAAFDYTGLDGQTVAAGLGSWLGGDPRG